MFRQNIRAKIEKVKKEVFKVPEKGPLLLDYEPTPEELKELERQGYTTIIIDDIS